VTLSIGVMSVGVNDGFLDYAREAEVLGVSSVWTAEFWGLDAFTPLAAIAAVTDRIKLGTGIAQIGARTPAMLAMNAMGVQAISNGRLLLGLGTSGPQVMEGWHGAEFSRPVQRTRETIEIVRMITSGERLEYDGEIYRLPLPDSAGVAIRSVARVPEIPIYVASLGPANLALTGELADGWIGNSFFTDTASVYFDQITAGAQRAGRSLSDIDLTVAVSVEFTDDVIEAGRRHADGYAFTFGAMGSGSKNFYNDAFARQGYGDDVAEVQRMWREGDRAAAAARVPIEIGFGTNLIGPVDTVRDRLREYRDCGVNTLRVNPIGDTLDQRVAGLGQLMDLVEEVNRQPVDNEVIHEGVHS
jgi:F420-dependent oxidoreductase-like protein